MTQTIVITSGKGGVGKTNISVNTAIELAERNYRTCLLDADLGLANVNILLGIDPEHTLDDYIFGDKNLDEIVLRTKFGIDVIPGSSGIEKMANLDREAIANLVSAFSRIKGYDFFLIDTSSGISRGVIAFCLAGNQTIIVITSEATSLTDAYALLKVMALNHYTGTVKILVNKSPSIPQAKQTYLRFKEVVNRHLDIKIAPAGIILNDPNVEISVTRQEPALSLYPNSLVSQCVRALVSNLLKNEPGKEDDGEDFSRFWQRYFEYSFLDPAQPDNPEEKDLPKTSFRLADPDLDGPPPSPGPAAMPARAMATVPPVAASVDHYPPAGTGKSPDSIAESIVPFVHGDGIFDLTRLASPTPLLATALELQARGELTSETLVEIFSCDPILLCKALKLICAPAAIAGRTRRLTAKHQLVQELGTETMANLLSTTAVQRALSQQHPSDSARVPAGFFWAHSYRCALLAEHIAEMTAYPFPEEAFMAGLIHDIGRLALQTDHPEVYGQFTENFRHDQTLLDMEQRLFNASHAEIAARTLRAWRLDSFLVDAVQYHTESSARIETAFSLVQIVALACRLSQAPEDEAETAGMGETLFGLSPAELQSAVARADQKIRQLAGRFDILFTGEEEERSREETETRFRRQAMDYSILQGVLPGTPTGRDLPATIHAVFQAFNILFGIQPAFCLLPDRLHSVLTAAEYPNCFGGGTLADLQFSLQWKSSFVVRSFRSGEVQTAMAEENSDLLPLADHQLLRSLGTQGFVCVPMMSHGTNRGIIVFGIEKNQLGTIRSWRPRLEQFGVQAAGKLYSLQK